MVVFELGAHVLKNQAPQACPAVVAVYSFSTGISIHGSIRHQIDEDRSQYYTLRVCTRIAVGVLFTDSDALPVADLSPQK